VIYRARPLELQSTLQHAEVFEFLEASATKCRLEPSRHSLRLGTIFFTLGPESALRFSFPLLLLPCLLTTSSCCLCWPAGMGVNNPDANFLVTLLGRPQF